MERIRAELSHRLRHGDVDGVRTALNVAQAETPGVREYAASIAVPLLEQLGTLWQLDDLDVRTVNDVTGIVGTALDDVAAATPPAPRRLAIPVVMACAPDEWHEMPARIITLELRERGWNVTHLGAAVPLDQLERCLRTEAPLAVTLSCTMPVHLVGAAEAIGDAHRLGVPVIAGGAGFGENNRRARAIGADHWSRDAADVDGVLQRWSRRRPTAGGRAPALPGVALTERNRAYVVDAARRALDRTPGSDRDPVDLSGRTARRLTSLLMLAESAALTGDERVLLEGVDAWCETRLTQGRDVDFFAPALHALAAAVDPGALRSLLLRAAAAGAGSSSSPSDGLQSA